MIDDQIIDLRRINNGSDITKHLIHVRFFDRVEQGDLLVDSYNFV